MIKVSILSSYTSFLQSLYFDFPISKSLSSFILTFPTMLMELQSSKKMMAEI